MDTGRWCPLCASKVLPKYWDTVAAKPSTCLTNHLSHENIRTPDVEGFVRQLLRQIPGPLIVVWDNSVTHRGRLMRELEQKRERLHIEYVPAYALELNPDEGVCSRLKGLLANGRPDDLADREDHLVHCLADIRSSQSKLRACVHKSELPPF